MSDLHFPGPIRIASSVVIGDNCTLGYPKEARLSAAVANGDTGTTVGEPVVIGERYLIFNQVIV